MVIAALVGSALLGLLGSCTFTVTDALQTAVVVNESDTPVQVFVDYPAGETRIMDLAPGESETTGLSNEDGCAPATLIARDQSGLEVDRIGRDFCVGDRWEIRSG